MLGPALAIESSPAFECLILKFSSILDIHWIRMTDTVWFKELRTAEFLSVDRLPAGAIMAREVSTLQHELHASHM